MKQICFLTMVVVAALLITGCGTPLPPGTEKGPHGTIAYLMSVDASPPGARIEANGQSLGNTPLNLKIFANRNGTFHDFGSAYYVIRAYPLGSGQFQQSRVFWTGRHGTPKDTVPSKVYFDMTQKTPVWVPPPEPPPAPNYPPPYYGPVIIGPPPPVFFWGGRRHF